MDTAGEMRRTRIDGEFHKCTACGYARGFHCSFVREGDEDGRFRVVLICPNCGARYHIGWSVEIEPEPGDAAFASKNSG